MNLIKTVIRDLTYIFANYFVANIPCWFIRKLFYRMMGMKIGKGSRICMKCIVMSPWKISIGDNTMINEFVLLDGRGELSIGSNSSISMWAILYSASHVAGSKEFTYYSKPTVVGDCCWIGTHSIIMPGSVFSDGSILSGKSSFKGISQSYNIYKGNPATLFRERGINTKYVLNNENFFK